MGISSAFSIAASGLRATSIQSDLVARNISNAQTEGYSRKSAELTTRNGAVLIAGVSREVDPLLDRLDRSNRAEQARASTIAGALSTYTDYLGQPEDQTSPVNALNRLYTSMLTLASSPGAAAAQLAAVEAAQALSGQINDLAVTLSELGREVDLNIRYDVASVNDNLTRLGQINARLGQIGGEGLEGADLKDEAARLIDGLSDFMDVQVTSFADGSVNLYTTGGTELLTQRRVTHISYDPTAGKLFAGNAEITPGAPGVRGFSAGSLAGLFELQGKIIPQLSQELDGFATLLVDRFRAIDDSLAPGEPGLFVDSAGEGRGAGGLAQRLTINPRVSPAKGGDPALLTSGLGSEPGLSQGDPALIFAMISVIDERVAGNTAFGERQSLSDYATSMVSGQQQRRVSAEAVAGQAAISGATISASRRNLQGVNLDDELQSLLVLEQSFAANSRVLSSLQSMMDDLFNAI
ncbi:flagellar hook-associated protein FlgK [Falsigemmobacter intermedius]|uniref:flagellar hook-associated protein FlgK n=1 Tax=Falsigemmobacter intermedius TaxID=1553448 RepID=UPI003F10F6D0